MLCLIWCPLRGVGTAALSRPGEEGATQSPPMRTAGPGGAPEPQCPLPRERPLTRGTGENDEKKMTEDSYPRNLSKTTETSHHAEGLGILMAYAPIGLHDVTMRPRFDEGCQGHPSPDKHPVIKWKCPYLCYFQNTSHFF